MLKFSEANAKTHKLATVLTNYLRGGREIYSLDLPAGISCPGAKDCKSCAVENEEGKLKIHDGQECRFRCFSASQEARFRPTYNARRHNLSLVRGKSRKSIRELLLSSIPKNAGVIRLHVSGDFFSRDYLMAIYDVARIRQDVLFYGYTKSLHLIDKYLSGKMVDPSRGVVCRNFLLTASLGGKYDELNKKIKLRTASVVFNENTSLAIDHDDSHASMPGGSFAILLHGTQPKGSEAARAKSALAGKGGYRR